MTMMGYCARSLNAVVLVFTQVDATLVSELLAMGCNELHARRALRTTNDSLPDAVELLGSWGDEALLNPGDHTMDEEAGAAGDGAGPSGVVEQDGQSGAAGDDAETTGSGQAAGAAESGAAPSSARTRRRAAAVAAGGLWQMQGWYLCIPHHEP